MYVCILELVILILKEAMQLVSIAKYKCTTNENLYVKVQREK